MGCVDEFFVGFFHIRRYWIRIVARIGIDKLRE
jgi:hypothetical protein